MMQVWMQHDVQTLNYAKDQLVEQSDVGAVSLSADRKDKFFGFALVSSRSISLGSC